MEMMMKKILLSMLLGSSVLSLNAAKAAEPKIRPNIILILADDLGFSEVGFNGQKKIRTPHLDAMAEAGALMTNFYAGAPVCGPSRSTLLYGQHTGHAPIRGNPKWTVDGKSPVMRADSTLLPKELKRAGYTTAVFGKWGMNEVITDAATGDGEGHPFRQGFDEFVGFNTHIEAHFHWPDYVWDGLKKIDLSGGTRGGNWRNKTTYGDKLFTEKTLDFIDRKHGDEKPFFVFLNYTAPHKGYSAPAKDKADYQELGWTTQKGKSGHYRNDADMNTAYAGMITSMDDGIGQIMTKLKELGISQNTLVMFTSDNGPEISWDFFDSFKDFRGGKRSVTDGGIRMPTVVHWPGVIKPGTEIDTPLAFWDLMPTFCELAETTPSGPTDGLSFVPALKGNLKDQHTHDYLYWEFNEKTGPMQALRFMNYKAIRTWNLKANTMGPIQLYDLSADKQERTNLAAAKPEVVQQAHKFFASARTEHPTWPLTPRPWIKKTGKK